MKHFQEKFIGHIGIGNQYDWLARYCANFKIDNMKLGVNREGAPWESLETMMSFSGEGLDRMCWMDSHYYDTDE